MKYFILPLAFLLSLNIIAQEHLPDDYLPVNFHKNRREALRAKLPANSVAVFFSNPIRNRANDVDYVYHQDPNFYYLTGYKEPHAVLIIFSETQEHINDNEILYVQERNAQAELWTGKRLGIEGAKTKLEFKTVFKGQDFISNTIDFNTFDMVLCFNFEDDYRNSKRNKADLFDLANTFKTAINYSNDAELFPVKSQIYQLIKSTSIENSANVAQTIGRAITYYPDLKKDKIIKNYQIGDNTMRKELKQQVVNIELPTPKYNTSMLPKFMAELREVKTPEEIKLLTKAVKISAIGQREVMKAMHPNMSETEIQGIHEFVYKKYGCEYEGYPSIVGAGHNGCVLHYIENSKTKVEGDLVLMDLGAEYHGYTADVTRTIPASGKFTKEQRAIYQIVLDAQDAGIKACQVGNSIWQTNAEARKVINKGLVKLGIIDSEDQKHNYFPHGTSHYIGLDVHDAGTYGNLKANSVITVEPGIYIPENSPCDKKWWGIAVRIEDDILITNNGPVNLSIDAPRDSNEIEKLMKQKSALDEFKLPKID